MFWDVGEVNKRVPRIQRFFAYLWLIITLYSSKSYNVLKNVMSKIGPV